MKKTLAFIAFLAIAAISQPASARYDAQAASRGAILVAIAQNYCPPGTVNERAMSQAVIAYSSVTGISIWKSTTALNRIARNFGDGASKEQINEICIGTRMAIGEME